LDPAGDAEESVFQWVLDRRAWSLVGHPDRVVTPGGAVGVVNFLFALATNITMR